MNTKKLIIFTGIFVLQAIAFSDPPLLELTAANITRSYEFYKRQQETVTCWSNNCGPTSTWMAMMMQVRDKAPTVEEIRDIYYNDCGWWQTVNIDDAFMIWGYNTEYVEVGYDAFILEDSLKDLMDAGDGAVVCLDMRRITSTTDINTRFNCYYTGVSCHFIFLKGYTVDGQWFVIYDPWCPDNNNYDDSSWMGKERYYNADEVCESMVYWDRHYSRVHGDKISPTLIPTETPGSTGDVNNDTSINIIDALLVAQYYVDLDPANFHTSKADTNCDGSINIIDALLISQYYVEIIDQFCS